MKFGRIYSLQAEGQDTSFDDGTQHIINFPLTCKFNISNACLSSGSMATFKIFNLSPDVRRDLNKDFFKFNEYRKIIFAAGYESELPIPIVFKGNIQLAYSYREGPDWVTEMTCVDGAYAKQNSQINISIPSPYHFDRVLEQIVKTMAPQNVGLGVIGNFAVPNSRGIVFSGNTWDLLVNTILPFRAQISINKEAVNIVQQNEVIAYEGVVDTIDAEHGLLESPRHQDSLMICKMLFEPRFEMYQPVQVTSIEPGNSGTWKILQVDHQGTISGAVCEDLNTMVTVFRADEEFVTIESDDIGVAA